MRGGIFVLTFFIAVRHAQGADNPNSEEFHQRAFPHNARPTKFFKQDSGSDSDTSSKGSEYAPSDSEDSAPKHTKSVDVDSRYGHGGPYGAVKKASKNGQVNADHSPHSSLLSYLNSNHNGLPDKLRTMGIQSATLEELNHLDRLNGVMEKLSHDQSDNGENTKKFLKPKDWAKVYRDDYYKNLKTISDLEETNKGLDIESQKEDIQGNKKKIADLAASNEDLRNSAWAYFRNEFYKGSDKYQRYTDLAKQDDTIKTNLENSKKLMATLSIPQYKHDLFPTTYTTGLTDDIKNLKDATPAQAQESLAEKEKFFRTTMDDGINNWGITRVETNGQLDLDATWKNCAETAFEKYKNNDREGKFFEKLKSAEASWFRVQCIVLVKTPTPDNLNQLMRLFINEYQTVLGTDFPNYKEGLQSWLDTQLERGWIDQDRLDNLKNHVTAIEGEPNRSNPDEWKQINDGIKKEAAKLEEEANPRPHSHGLGTSGNVCDGNTRRRRKRSPASSSCLINIKRDTDEEGLEKPRNIDEVEEEGHKKTPPSEGVEDLDRRPPDSNSEYVKPNIEVDDDWNKPRLNIPTGSSADINSRALANQLLRTGGVLDDADSLTLREAIKEYAIRNPDKLTGTTEEIERAKALLKRAVLESGVYRNEMAKNLVNSDSRLGTTAQPTVHPSRFEKIKLSSQALAKKLASFPDKTDKVSGKYGKFMLGKSVYNSLRHGDSLGLALIGGRLALDPALKGIYKLSTHIGKKMAVKTASEFGKSFIGKAAGPIGAFVDIGMNAYSIYRSVKVLKDPNASKYDVNDAVADIVLDSIDIATTATAAVLSIVFPPLAPIFAAGAFIVNFFATLVVSAYKVDNYINRLNDEIPLLDYEKINEINRYLTLRDTSQHIKDLRDVKRANNIVVNMTVQFMENNTDFVGVVVPSRTTQNWNPTCHLQYRYCKYIGLYCSNWNAKRSRYNPGLSKKGREQVRNRCDTDDPPPELFPVVNNTVEFLDLRNVYLDRSAPDFNLKQGLAYVCKPSSNVFLGDEISNQTPTSNFLCDGAIAVKRNSGRVMLFDLGEGDDSVRLDENDGQDNHFIIKGGHKSYHGNKGDDTFYLDSNCSHVRGMLDGKMPGSVGNTLIFGPQCSPTQNIHVDLTMGTAIVGEATGYFFFRNINRLIGRSRMKETIRLSCSNTFLCLNGGLAHSPDEVHAGYCSAPTKITLIAKGYTNIELGRPHCEGTIVVLADDDSRIAVYLQITESRGSSRVTVPILAPAHTLKGYTRIGRTQFTLDLGNSSFLSLDIPESDLGNLNVMFVNENYTSVGNVVVGTGNQAPYVLHVLGDNNPIAIRSGAVGVRNIFRLESGRWDARGGQKDDFFLIAGGGEGGIINGYAGEDTLVLAGDLVGPIQLDLQRGTLLLKTAQYNVTGVENVNGAPGRGENITTNCNTRVVVTEGGTMLSWDEINIPSLGCPHEMDLFVESFTRIHNKAWGNGNFTYHINTTEHFDIQYKSSKSAVHVFNFTLPLSSIRSITKEGNGIEITFPNTSKSFQLGENNTGPSFFISDGYHHTAEVIIDEHDVSIQIFLHSGSVAGINGSTNVIILNRDGQGQTFGHITGGALDDHVHLEGYLLFVRQIDGMGGYNRMVLDPSFHPGIGVHIDLQKGNLHVGNNTVVESVDNIQEIIGRGGNENDQVSLACDTAWVTGVSEIIIRDTTCTGQSIQLEVGPRTRVKFFVVDDGRGSQDDTLTLSDSGEANRPLTAFAASEFHYRFTGVRSFDVEVDRWASLWKTRHYFYLHFKVSDLQSLSFLDTTPRLVYKLAMDGLEYSHLLVPRSSQEIYYTIPEFMTADGFLIRISMYGEVLLTHANPDEILDLAKLLPWITFYSQSLKTPFLVETSKDFVYSGVPDEVSVLTNRLNRTSHLAGFNQTTYVILSLDKDVFIYANGNKVGRQVVDITELVQPIRRKAQTKYVPHLAQEGDDIVITVPGYEAIFPAKVIIVSGVNCVGSLLVLLATVAMRIEDTGNGWRLVPIPIDIPPGYLFVLASEDLEEGAIINKSFSDDDNTTFVYAKDGNDLMVTNIDAGKNEEEVATLILTDYFITEEDSKTSEDSFSHTTSFHGVSLQFEEHKPLKLRSDGQLFLDSGESVATVFYEDILEEAEEVILSGQDAIPRLYQVSNWRKFYRKIENRYAFYIIPIIAAVALMAVLCFVFIRQSWRPRYQRAEVEYEIPHLSFARFDEGMPCMCNCEEEITATPISKVPKNSSSSNSKVRLTMRWLFRNNDEL